MQCGTLNYLLMRKIHLYLFVLLAILASCKKKESVKKNTGKPPVPVEVIVASDQDFVNNIEVNGSVLANEMVELHPEVSGRIVYLNVPDGGMVTEGTVLVRINDAELQAQLEQQKNQLDLATKTEQRYKTLIATNSINQSDYDAAISQVNNYKALVNVTLALIDKTVIKAPFSGRLGLRQVSPGAYVNPQSVISTLQQTDKLKVDFTMPESYSNLVKTGDTISLNFNGVAGSRKAIISALEPQISTTTRNIKARALMIGGGVSPGTFAKVTLNQRYRGIMIPSNAIIPDALSNMVVLVKENKAKFVKVETGIRTVDGVELVSGVTPGDSVVVSGVLFVRPESPLKIKKSRSQK
jgi:membrane fusion protein (multidrug efflux system)